MLPNPPPPPISPTPPSFHSPIPCPYENEFNEFLQRHCAEDGLVRAED
ncbi:hypothetical protein RRG08_041117 [Elysia crispata]|uniref:Uncharacterized protein n=1 Tax=Elysia crispata TaxID=231223 RepID=A0AAE0XYR4_9GAST|nr:hypothetical protein RRG08_041117 [Elysia crispata]